MGHTADFLDLRIYDPVDRLEARPKKGNQSRARALISIELY